MTLREVQLEVQLGWTGELYSDEFKARRSAYKDFDHALKHIRKASQALENMTELADHGSLTPFSRKDVSQYLADLVICAARLANVCPGDKIDLDLEVMLRIKDKIRPKG